MITFNLTYQIILTKYFSLRYLRGPLKYPKVSWKSKETELKFDIWEVCQKVLKHLVK